MNSVEAVNNKPKVAIPSEYLYKQPSSNETISYTLVSLINHHVDSLVFGYYVSDVFDSSTGIWWHCDDDNITQIIDVPKGVYDRETHKNMKKKKKTMKVSIDVLFVVYIKTIHLIKHSSHSSRIHNHVQNHSYEESD